GSGTIPGFNDQEISTFNVAATVQPVRQSHDITIDTVSAGQVYSLAVNGITISYTATPTDTASTIRNQLISRINTDSATLGVTAVVVDADTLQLRAVTPGNGFTVSNVSAVMSDAVVDANVPASFQTDGFIFTGTPGELGDTFTISLSGITGGFPPTRSWTYTTTGEEGSINSIANGLAALINSDPDSPAIASVQGGILTLRAKQGVPIPTWSVDGAAGAVTVTGPVSTGQQFTVTLNGTDYTYTAIPGDTETEVRNGLLALIPPIPGITETPVGPDGFTLTGAAGLPLALTVTGALTSTVGGTRTTNGTIPPHIGVTFGAAGDPLRAGTITGLSAANVAGGSAEVPANQLTGDRAYVDVTLNYGSGPQTVRIFLGTFGLADGVTQFAGADYAVRSLDQNGVPQGSFSSLTIRETGDVLINYDNGQSRVINRVPVVTFNEPEKLERIDGQAFMRTIESGEARVLDPTRDGAGKLVVGSIERSNVDIAAEFSKLIIAQRAYTANTRIVSASDEMLLDTINMKR
ncbi:MAG: flagellar hook-basal body complex protein, partial [Acetobacteraceae bacterium]